MVKEDIANTARWLLEIDHLDERGCQDVLAGRTTLNGAQVATAERKASGESPVVHRDPATVRDPHKQSVVPAGREGLFGSMMRRFRER